MKTSTRLRLSPFPIAAVLLAAAMLPLTGCEDELLEFEDPDIILEAKSASGAIALKNGAIQRFNNVTVSGTSDQSSLVLFGGLLADEWRSGDTFEQRNQADQRNIPPENTFLDDQLRNVNRVRLQAQLAIRALREFAPTPDANIGLMFALSAYAENLVGEHYCNGHPFSELAEDQSIIAGGPVTNDSAFTRALASADSALLYINGTDGPRVRDLARIVKGRAYLNLNRPSDAAAAVAAVATNYRYSVGHSVNTDVNMIWSLNTGQKRYVVADLEGGNGLPFVTAHDPRLVTGGTGNAFDSQTPYIAQLTYGQFDSVAMASGIEARLIEAESALRAGDAATWLAKLNEARATRTDLPALTDPGTTTDRENLLFYERGFWMFGTGHRLGDMRRLIRQYNRPAESVFATGAFPKGGSYGTDVNIVITIDELNNPGFTGCIDRNP